MVATKTYSTKSFGIRPPKPMDLDDDGTLGFFGPLPCDGMVSASAQVVIVEGTGSAFVLTVQVSNDPEGQAFTNHPSTITLTNSAQVTAVFSVVGYKWLRIQLTTINSGNLLAHVHVCMKDSPA